eukprot:CAMPEP_0117013786 /NCGR_PEP_ID=MMETSP0472-20121206/11310_1 /TAXON_ID=693140 ORGANISM="Tiarina fusus, Strain LIS" /NCGR_SAMPLE_ID=MMETSP0472 /ASSEMBLY_ACC=CAM_ASM_000603 /LENGTH=287 /DNA_ID=CAMNT_0004717191 /DNA_START=118 /DNA_END=981 /DNA_ORIENTATION=-
MASQARFLLQFLDAAAGSSSRDLQEDFTPEDVDLSEAGWSTDFACAVLALCFVVTSFASYDRDKSFHFMYMHLGTFIAHLFGGFAHAWFPNRASDGVGQVGFYVTIGIGYLGNCMRYGWGWGLPTCWKVFAAMNMVWLTVAAVFAIVNMERTTERLDDAESDPDDPFKPDTFFGFGELFCAIMEILASIYYVARVDRSFYAWMASLSNLAGWVSVYAVGLYAAGTGFEYDTRITQLIFHYAMIVFLWAINELALRKCKDDDENTPKSSSRKQQEPPINSSESEVEDA